MSLERAIKALEQARAGHGVDEALASIKEFQRSRKMRAWLKPIKSGPIFDLARNTLVCGCVEQGAYIQFGADVQLYGLWEALLFARNYEQKGCYAPGTVDKVFEVLERELK